MIGNPIRSLIDPPGLKNSAFANTGVRIPFVMRDRRMSGVHPIVSSTLSYGRSWRLLMDAWSLAPPEARGRYLPAMDSLQDDGSTPGKAPPRPPALHAVFQERTAAPAIPSLRRNPATHSRSTPRHG